MPLFEKMKQPKILSFVLLLCTLIIGIGIGTIINTGVKAAKQSGSTAAPDATPLTIPARHSDLD